MMMDMHIRNLYQALEQHQKYINPMRTFTHPLKVIMKKLVDLLGYLTVTMLTFPQKINHSPVMNMKVQVIHLCSMGNCTDMNTYTLNISFKLPELKNSVPMK